MHDCVGGGLWRGMGGLGLAAECTCMFKIQICTYLLICWFEYVQNAKINWFHQMWFEHVFISR